MTSYPTVGAPAQPVPSPTAEMRPQPIPRQKREEASHLRVVAGGAGAKRGQEHDEIRFKEIYERWFGDVVKWLYALGAPSTDTEDLAQEIFLVVRKNLVKFHGGNLAGWLYRITQLTVRDHRRRAWFRNLVQRREEVDLTQFEHLQPGPAQSYEDAERRRVFQLMVAKMSEKLRSTFVLFEIEGYSGDEIARIQDIPLGTVWTRLHHARKEFWKLVKERRRDEENKK
jgi:RNA polymerase sigma-70 factor (ECF subfamily)